MPYIKPEDRERIDNIPLGDFVPASAGEIQYAIATLIHSYLNSGPGKFNYQKCNDVMGALAGAQMEFYRLVVAPYENEKIVENGEVYDVYRYKHPLKKGNY